MAIVPAYRSACDGGVTFVCLFLCVGLPSTERMSVIVSTGICCNNRDRHITEHDGGEVGHRRRVVRMRDVLVDARQLRLFVRLAVGEFACWRPARKNKSSEVFCWVVESPKYKLQRDQAVSSVDLFTIGASDASSRPDSAVTDVVRCRVVLFRLIVVVVRPKNSGGGRVKANTTM